MKFVLIGESTSGKTSLIQRFNRNEFSDHTESTIGALYIKKSIESPSTHKTLNFQLFDTAGQEAYHSLVPLYLRNFRVAIIVFDVTSMSSLEKAKYWIRELMQRPEVDGLKEGKVSIALCGNKIDVVGQRVIGPQHELAKRHGFQYFETSAKTGKGVRDMFIELHERTLGDEAEADNIALEEDVEEEDEKRCMCRT